MSSREPGTSPPNATPPEGSPEMIKTLSDVPWGEAAAEEAVLSSTGETWVETPPSPRRESQPRRPGFGTTVLPEVDRSAAKPVLRPRTEPRFVVTGSLGEGALGEVISAMDQDIGRRVAIKRVRADRRTDAILVRFLQEIQTVGRLEHANIVPIHDVGRDSDGNLFFVMRHVDGDTLEAIIGQLRRGDPAAHRAYGFERRVQIIAAVLEALAFAHSRGVIHRDVKPANVMVGRYGEVMLLDWGIARLTEADPDADTEEPGAPPRAAKETRAGAILGTPAYMSPEQARGDRADVRSDLYAVTVMMHELLTLQHYLSDCTSADAMLAAIPTRAVPFATTVASPHQDRVPADLGWFIEKGVAKDPAERYLSAEEMLVRLARRAEGDVPVQCHVTFAIKASHVIVRWMNEYGMASALIVGLIVVGATLSAMAGIVAFLLAVGSRMA